ncbi:hypothetical protein BD310DRAFT_392026 [Dichomitus squalens]|uniref:Uncharacterized protein n=1 Tax=Dichomitus squalens TaxID=114155 RepID=A0A4Q9Q9L2_9APHY|nr:hypothetical protein BD310DRAFT_392026 [Dichomitus squalens]
MLVPAPVQSPDRSNMVYPWLLYLPLGYVCRCLFGCVRPSGRQFPIMISMVVQQSQRKIRPSRKRPFDRSHRDWCPHSS